jgi:TP901 family phage tail tape measure protein
MHEIGDLVVRLIADIREFMGKMDEAEAKVGEFAGVSEKSSARFGKAMSKIGTAVIGASAVIAGYGLKAAYDYGKTIEAIGFQSGATATEVDRLKTHILDLSVATATSATDLAAAYTQVEKAGFSGAKADALVSNAAKLAKLSNTDLITSTKDLIAVQALQANGSKDAAASAGLLLQLTKNSVGSMSDLNALFTGKPAATAASYGISLANMATGVEAVAKHGLDANVAMTSLSAGLTRMIKPSSSVNDLLVGTKTKKGIGMNQQQLADDFRKPNGLFVALNDLKTHFVSAGYPAQQFGAFLTQLAGPRGSAGFGVMAKYLGDMTKYYPQLVNSSKQFADSWAAFQKTPEFKFGKLKESFNKAMIQIGNFILPVAIDIANALLKAQKWLSDPKHKIYTHLIADVAIGVVATAIISKVTGAIQKWTNTGVEAKTLAQGVTQISLLTEIAANTLAMAGELVTVAAETGVVATETGVVATEVGTLAASKLLYGMGALMTYLPVIALILGTAFGLKKLLVDPISKQIVDVKKNLDGGGLMPPMPGLMPAPKGSGGYTTVTAKGNGTWTNYQLTVQQKQAIDSYFASHHLSETDKSGYATQAFLTALSNMQQADYNKKYTVTVKVK